MLLYWVIVNFNIIFIFTRASSIYRRIEMCKTGSTLSLALFNLILCVMVLSLSNLSRYSIAILDLNRYPIVFSYPLFLSKTSISCLEVLDPRWISLSSFFNAHKLVFSSLFMRCLSVMDFSKC